MENKTTKSIRDVCAEIEVGRYQNAFAVDEVIDWRDRILAACDSIDNCDGDRKTRGKCETIADIVREMRTYKHAEEFIGDECGHTPKVALTNYADISKMELKEGL